MTGSCHCGAVTLKLAEKPDYLFDCNCSMCSKHGVLWGYFDPRQVTISGATKAYSRIDREVPAVDLHFCGTCGCSTHWTPKGACPARPDGHEYAAFCGTGPSRDSASLS